MKEFKELKMLMRQMDLNTTDVSKLMGVSIHTVSKWVRGERTPARSAVCLVNVLLTLSAVMPDLMSHLGLRE